MNSKFAKFGKIEAGRELAGVSLGSTLRKHCPGLSWSGAKGLITGRRVEVNGVVCVNDARRVKADDCIELFDQPRGARPTVEQVRLLHIDPHLLVVEKPAGVATLRRDEEAGFTAVRKELEPSLDELVARMLPGNTKAFKRANVSKKPYAVHRLDRDTSGLMLFAMTPAARDLLIDRFSRHEIVRSYLAVAHGGVKGGTIESWMVRDRGDGLRGSVLQGRDKAQAKRAVSHFEPVEYIDVPGKGTYTLLRCRLETGRTHQIRIHLAEAGHMLCGEKLYLRSGPGAEAVRDLSGAPRHALHSAALSFKHPATGAAMSFTSPMPADLAKWLDRLRGK